ncbi:hypothetical protein RRG08_062097 [Elysia crispata]|uniref:Uncharacterized protein n=1 Tax=Elysia crispata TaxID=231223 RepID=A0AAE1BAM5_9GAST|nr:hypothetical protein RRG08_062097 [Elysia crispata]
MITLILATLVVSASATFCSDGWIESRESVTCIKVMENDKTWQEARTVCKSLGGDLVKIVNKKMNDFVYASLYSLVRGGTQQKRVLWRNPNLWGWKMEYLFLQFQPGFHLREIPRAVMQAIGDLYVPKSVQQGGTERSVLESAVVIALEGTMRVTIPTDHVTRAVMQAIGDLYVVESVQKEKCSSGTYGGGCKQPCSEHCVGQDNSCDHVYGTCDLGCDPGFQGFHCTQKCDPGYYGKDCIMTCSEFCGGNNTSCHHVNGSCDLGCLPGYQSVLCVQECPEGKYGVNCSTTCSVHCAGRNNPCDHKHGSCDQGCDAGYRGSLCTQNCQAGRYGAMCSGTCSVHCAGKNNACDHVDGSCDQGCDAGYWGSLCTQECPAGSQDKELCDFDTHESYLLIIF